MYGSSGSSNLSEFYMKKELKEDVILMRELLKEGVITKKELRTEVVFLSEASAGSKEKVKSSGIARKLQDRVSKSIDNDITAVDEMIKKLKSKGKNTSKLEAKKQQLVKFKATIIGSKYPTISFVLSKAVSLLKVKISVLAVFGASAGITHGIFTTSFFGADSIRTTHGEAIDATVEGTAKALKSKAGDIAAKAASAKTKASNIVAKHGEAAKEGAKKSLQAAKQAAEANPGAATIIGVITAAVILSGTIIMLKRIVERYLDGKISKKQAEEAANKLAKGSAARVKSKVK